MQTSLMRLDCEANDTQVTDSEPHAANMLDSLVTLAGAGVAAGVAFVGIPVVVGAVGFTGAGIAAGILAAKMMSAAAVANGGGVAAGSVVAVLQSIGLTKRSRYPSDQGVWVRVSVMVGFIPIAVGATVGLGVATVAVPAALGAVGFTGAGIAAGTLAAKMMSAAAVANGGGVAAGSTVAVLQSVGAAGLSLATKGAVTAVGGALAFFFPK